MKRLVTWLTAALIAAGAWAQQTATRITVVGSLPSPCTTGTPYIVTDGNSATDCATGSGSTIHMCYCDAAGTGYDSQPAGADGVGYDEIMEEGSGLTQRAQLNFIGSTITCVDNGGATRTDCTVSIPTASWQWTAAELTPDGVQCRDWYGETIASGPIEKATVCADNAASAFYGSVLLERYAGGTIIFTLEAVNTNATPSGILDFDISAQCRGDSDAMNSTWGTAANASITFDTQNDLEHADTSSVTPNGTCAAGDTMFFRAVMDDTATTTQVADVLITRVSMLEE